MNTKLPKFKLEWLYYFEVLAEAETFQTAAERLFITQQALSLYLRRLEERMGVVLLQRFNQDKTLTPEGQRFLKALKPILTQVRQLQQRFEPLADVELQGPVRLMLEPLWMTPAMATRLVEVQQLQPGLQLQISGQLSETGITDGLLQGHLDMAIFSPVTQHPELLYLPLLYSPCVIVGIQDSATPWQALPFIRYLRGGELPTKAIAQKMTFWPEATHPRQVVFETNCLEQAIACCLQGIGALYLPEIFVRTWLQQRQLRLLTPAPAQHEEQACLVWNPAFSQGTAYESFLCELGQFILDSGS